MTQFASLLTACLSTPYPVWRILYVLGFSALIIAGVSGKGFARTDITDTTASAALSRTALESLINQDGMNIHRGNHSVDLGQAVDTPLVVVDGTAFVSGRINGDLVVINGNASLQQEAFITGDLTVVGGYIYTSRRATVQGQQLIVDAHYVVTRARTGRLRLRPDQPGPLALKIRPDGWRFSRVRGHDIDLTLGLFPRRPVWYPRVTGTVSVPTVMNNHGFLDFRAVVEEPLFERRTLRLGVEGYKTTETNDAWHMPSTLNSLSAFITNNDFYNYYLRRGFTVSARQQTHEAISLGMEYRHDAFRNLGTQDPFTLFGGNRSFRVNPDIDEGDIHSLVWSVNYDTGVAEWQGGNAWYLDAELERAIKAFGSNFEYTRYDIAVRRYNKWRGHQLDIRAKFAGSGAPLPLQRSYVLGAFSGLRGFGDFEYAGDRLLVVNAEYRLPVTTWRRKAFIKWNLEILAFFDTGTAFFSSASGRNVPGSAALQSRVNPHLGLASPDSYGDLRSDAGIGLSISSRLFYATVHIAQNLHDTAVKPRVLLFLYRDIF